MSNFTPRAQQVLALARKEADRFNHNFVGTEHLLLGLIKLGQGVAVNVLQKMGLDLETVRLEVEKQVGTGPDQKQVGNIPYTPRVKKVLNLASKEAKQLQHTYVGTEHILLGLLREGEGVAARVLKNLDIDIEQTRQEILKELDPNFAVGEDEMDEEGETAPTKGGGKKGNKTPALRAFGRDMTEIARKGELDPMIGREDEIERVIQILCRRTKNNPVLLGEAGVGMPPAVRGTLVDADVILAVGARFGEMTTGVYSLFGTGGKADDGQRIVHVHASAYEFGKVVAAEVTVNAGPNAACRALAAMQPVAVDRWTDWRAQRRSAFLETLDCPPQLGDLDMGEVTAWLRHRLPADVVVTNGAGNFSTWPNKFLLYGAEARLLAPQNGTMGYGLPAAVAAKVAGPDRTVVCFAGDGDVQMNLQELGTAMQADARPIVLVVDNSSWGTIRMHQELHHPGRVSATDLVNPDFVALAGAYGMHAEKVTRTDDFAPAFERAMASPTGALLHLVTSTDQLNPWLTVEAARRAVTP